MKHKILPVKNVVRLKAAGDALVHRSLGMPGLGLVSGPTGYGKTTATAWQVAQTRAVYVRALRVWSPRTMLENVARELDIDVRGKTNGSMVEAIIQRLAETGRALFIDEADYIVDQRRLLDTLRDIHDMSTAPVVLIGMEGIERRIKGNEQFTGRISQWVRFEGIDAEDARILADGLCEVGVADDLLDTLHTAASPKNGTGAEIRRLVVGLGNIEHHARRRGLQQMSLADWPKGNDFFVGTPADTTPARVAPLKGVR